MTNVIIKAYDKDTGKEYYATTIHHNINFGICGDMIAYDPYKGSTELLKEGTYNLKIEEFKKND